MMLLYNADIKISDIVLRLRLNRLETVIIIIVEPRLHVLGKAVGRPSKEPTTLVEVYFSRDSL